jgi:hypothetical protein
MNKKAQLGYFFMVNNSYFIVIRYKKINFKLILKILGTVLLLVGFVLLLNFNITGLFNNNK